jgi:uncharacterized OB-fold protein
MSTIENWRLRRERLRMKGEFCGGCERAIFPPRDICPHCGSDDTSTIIEYRPGIERRIELTKTSVSL